MKQSRARWPRVLASIVVAVFHIAFVMALIDALRTRNHLLPSETVITTLILSPAAIPSQISPVRMNGRPLSSSTVPMSLLALPSLPAIAAPNSTSPSTDWAAEAQLAATVVSRTDHGLHEGTAASAPHQGLPAAAHHEGDQYKSSTGEWIVWVSDYCYQIDAVAPGVPDVLVHPLIPTTICPGARSLSSKLGDDLLERLRVLVRPEQGRQAGEAED